MEDHTRLGNSTLPPFYLPFNKEKVHSTMRVNFGRLNKSSNYSQRLHKRHQATSHPHAHTMKVQLAYIIAESENHHRRGEN